MNLSWRGIPSLWNRFFYNPQSIRTAAFLRIGLGTICLVTHIVRGLSLPMFFSESGMMPNDVVKPLAKLHDWGVFLFLPSTDSVMWVCYWLCLIQLVMFTLGLWSRVSTVCVFIWLVSYHMRNSVVECGGDTVIRPLMFYLMFVPTGKCWSIDSWICKRKKCDPSPAELPMWGLRMVQLQMCLVFLSAAVAKSNGRDWVEGDALYYVARAGRFWQRIPWPDFLISQRWAYAPLTWSVILIEAMVPILIWFKETRIPAICLAIALHLGIEFSMAIFLFEWTMIVAWLSFLNANDWQKAESRFPFLAV